MMTTSANRSCCHGVRDAARPAVERAVLITDAADEIAAAAVVNALDRANARQSVKNCAGCVSGSTTMAVPLERPPSSRPL